MGALKECNPEEDEETQGNRLKDLTKHWCAIKEFTPEDLLPKLKNHQGIKDLKKYVLARKKTADKIACKEKVNPQLEKFKYPTLYPNLEKIFWDRHANHQSKTRGAADCEASQ